jgi:hypothetical protein
MAEFFTAIDDKHRAFIERQPMFFVATAAAGARVNLSPKGMDVFRVLGPNRVAYLDLGGSGNETQAHLAADGRITIMFCAFDNSALILRLYGHGSFIGVDDPGFEDMMIHFPRLPGMRQIFDIRVDSVQTSCGWAVPRMTFERERDTLVRFHRQQVPEERLAKIAARDRSIDGLRVAVQKTLPTWTD